MSGPGIPWTAVENALQAAIVTGTGLAAQTDGSPSVIWAMQQSSRPIPPFADIRWGVIKRTGYDWIDYADVPLVLTPITITGRSGNSLTATAHGLFTGDGPIQFTTTGTLPGGLTVATNYWIIAIDANTIQLATTFQNAWVPTAVTLTSAGSGTNQIVSTVNTRRAGAELVAKSRGMRRVKVTVQLFGATAIGASGAAQLLDQFVSSLPQQRAALVAAGIGVLSVGPVNSTEGIISSTILEPRAILEIIISLASQVLDPETYIERVVVTGTTDASTVPTTVDGTIPPINH